MFAAAPCAAQAAEPSRHEVVVLGTHRRLALPREVERIAVGDESILSVELLNTREALALGSRSGTTTMLVWYADDSHESILVRVRPDLSLLQGALQAVAPGVTVDIAPDRDVLVLQGTVRDAVHREAVVEMAHAYLAAVPLSRVRVPSTEGAAVELDPAAGDGAPGAAIPAGRVIDLLTLEELPGPIEERIREAIAPVAGDGVRVRRIVRGQIGDDDADVLVLEGEVEDQIALVRAMQLAARLFLGDANLDGAREAIEVVADEAGGLVQGQGNLQNLAGGRGGGAGGGGRFGGGGQGGGFAGGQAGGVGVQQNQVQRNLGRATVLSMAQGRILSFVEVRDRPQVRVAVQVFEIDRDRLFQLTGELQALASDFPQPALVPSEVGERIQPAPANAGAFSDSDVQAGLASLADGFSQQVQVSGKNFALDVLLRALEARGIARRLSSPVLTVLNGETAQFQVGGEVPVPQAFTPAAGATAGLGTFASVDFRAFGIGLGVRPLVGRDGEVLVDLSSIISQPDEVLTTVVRNATGTDPQTTAFSTRALQTNARLADGESLLVGGLVSRSLRDDVSKTPILGDLPLIGWLFRSTNDSYRESELFVMVTPSIVRPAVPGSGIWLQPTLGEIVGPFLRRRDDAPAR